MNNEVEQPKAEEPERVIFHQQKGSLFRVVHTDGVWCSPGPHEHLHLIFFNERHPIPTQTVYELRKDGQLGEEVVEQRDGKKGIIRELEVDIVLNLKTAYSLRGWLDDYLNEVERTLMAEEEKEAK